MQRLVGMPKVMLPLSSRCRPLFFPLPLLLSACFGSVGVSGGNSTGDIDATTQCIQLADPVGRQTTGKIGQTETGRFEQVFSLQDIYLIFGAQGGHHIDISVQFYTETEGRWRHTVQLIDSTNEEVVGHGEAVFDACTSGWSQTDYVRIHVVPTGWVDCRIEVTSTPLDTSTNDRLRQSLDVRVRSPQT